MTRLRRNVSPSDRAARAYGAAASLEHPSHRYLVPPVRFA
jgi:hypothetical protein